MNIKLYVDYGEKSEAILKIIKPHVDDLRRSGHVLTTIKVTPKDKNMKVPTLTTSSGVNISGINSIREFLRSIIFVQKPVKAQEPRRQVRQTPSTDDFMRDTIMNGEDETNEDNELVESAEQEIQNRLSMEIERRKLPSHAPSRNAVPKPKPKQSYQPVSDEDKFIMSDVKPQKNQQQMFVPKNVNAARNEDERDDAMMENMLEGGYD